MVSDDCWEELAAFKADRASNLNKDVPLAKACRGDVKKHCSKKKYDRSNAADVLDCLRRVKKKKVRAVAGAGVCFGFVCCVEGDVGEFSRCVVVAGHTGV